MSSWNFMFKLFKLSYTNILDEFHPTYLRKMSATHIPWDLWGIRSLLLSYLDQEFISWNSLNGHDEEGVEVKFSLVLSGIGFEESCQRWLGCHSHFE
jgi:hypothetical protein